MKIRSGFVSNSSSSSFLVAFPRNPKNVDDVKDMVFGSDKRFYSPYDSDSWDTKEIAEVIWNDIKDQIPNNKNVIMSRMHNVAYDEYDNFYLPRKEGQSDWERDFDYDGWDIANREKVDGFMQKQLAAGCYLYHVEYSDNGEGRRGVAMEHGKLFKRLKHLVSSNH